MDVFSGAGVSAPVTSSGGSVTVEAQAAVSGAVHAAISSEVYSPAAVSGDVSASAGDATVTSGAVVSGKVSAGGTATVTALGRVSGDVTALGDASVTTNDALYGAVTASGNATITATGDVAGAVSAGKALSLQTLGKLSADASAGTAADVTAQGDLKGKVTAGTDATVFSFGDLTGDVSAGGNANVTAWGKVADAVNASGDATVEAVTGDMTARVTSGGDATVSADSQGSGTQSVTLSAGVNGAVSSFAPLDLSGSAGGTLSVTAQGDATLEGVHSAGDLTVVAGGGLTANGSLTSEGGSLSATSGGDLEAAAHAAKDVTLLSLGHLSGSVRSGGTASVTSYGFMNASNISGDAAVNVTALDQAQTSASSANGSVTVTAAGPLTLMSLEAGQDATVSGMSTTEVVASNVTGNLDVSSGDQVQGLLKAGGDVSVTTLKDSAAEVDAGRDAVLRTVGRITGAASAGRDVEATAYAGIQLDGKSLIAGHDIRWLWSRGDLSGHFTAGHRIGIDTPTPYAAVQVYGSADADIRAGVAGAVADAKWGQIDSVSSWGGIGGSVTADHGGPVSSGGPVTATVTYATPTTVQASDVAVRGEYPADPQVGLGAAHAALRQAAGQVAGMATALSQTRVEASNAGQAAQAQLDLAGQQLGDSMSQGMSASMAAIDQSNREVATAGVNSRQLPNIHCTTNLRRGNFQFIAARQLS